MEGQFPQAVSKEAPEKRAAPPNVQETLNTGGGHQKAQGPQSPGGSEAGEESKRNLPKCPNSRARSQVDLLPPSSKTQGTQLHNSLETERAGTLGRSGREDSVICARALWNKESGIPACTWTRGPLKKERP